MGHGGSFRNRLDDGQSGNDLFSHTVCPSNVWILSLTMRDVKKIFCKKWIYFNIDITLPVPISPPFRLPFRPPFCPFRPVFYSIGANAELIFSQAVTTPSTKVNSPDEKSEYPSGRKASRIEISQVV